MHHPHTVRSSVTEDVEKSANDVISPRSDSLEKRTFSSHSTTVLPLSEPSSLVKWNTRIESLAGLEARGIVRVPPEGRQESSIMAYAQMAILWFSINMSANNVTVPMLGPLVFDLGFVDSVLMATFGCLLGSAGVAYMAIWGAQSGNRTMVCSNLYTEQLSTIQNYSTSTHSDAEESLTFGFSHHRLWLVTLWVTGLRS